jgi:arginase
LAVKIVRQPKKIALIGAPSSAAAFALGTEKAPAALRAAGLVGRLHSAGYEVIDHGDCAPRLFADDEEHRRARNLPEIVAGLNDLKARAEVAVKSGALVLVLGGDCAHVIGLLAAARRYYKHLNLLWFDRDADLNTPASTPSGRIDGMVTAHIIGKGAPELVRFWGEAPLVREPDVVLFGLERLDPPERDFLTRSPMRQVYAADVRLKGGAKSAADELEQMHAGLREFVVHLDTDVIANEDFPAVDVPGANGGLSLADTRAALSEFVRHKNLLGLDISQYNPDKDPDGSSAKNLVDLVVDALTARMESLNAPSSPAQPIALVSAPEPPAAAPLPPEPAQEEPSAAEPEGAPEVPPTDAAPKEPSAAAELPAANEASSTKTSA